MLLGGALTPAALHRLTLARLPLRLTRSALLRGAWLTLLRARRLLSPAALVRRLPLVRRLTLRRPALLRRLLWTLPPTAATLARRRLLTPAALPSPPPLLLPAWLAPRLPRTPRSLRRRRHIRSF